MSTSKGTQIYLKLDGVQMPTPSEYTYTEADFDSSDSARSETGVLVRKRIRRGVHTIKCKWNAITTEQLKILQKAVIPETLRVEVFSPTSERGDHLVEYKGYAQATRSSAIVLPRNDPMKTLWSFECSFIEY